MAEKGVSPLIAAALLIGITMLIAVFMGNWGASFVESETSQLECVLALDIDAPTFDNEVVSVKIRNTDDKISLEGLRVTLEYSDVNKNIEYIASENGVEDPLPPGTVDWFNVDTDEATEPLSVEVVALSCPKGAIKAKF